MAVTQTVNVKTVPARVKTVPGHFLATATVDISCFLATATMDIS
jgi:hypothetical protein